MDGCWRSNEAAGASGVLRLRPSDLWGEAARGFDLWALPPTLPEEPRAWSLETGAHSATRHGEYA